jgi:predicted dehydrogenase
VTNNDRPTDSLTVAVLGTGRMASIHLTALAALRDRGLSVDGRTVRVEPAVYGRDAAKVRAAAEQHRIRRTSTRLEELIDAPDNRRGRQLPGECRALRTAHARDRRR